MRTAGGFVQIRLRYAATVGELRLTVDAESDGCSAEVIGNGRILYAARRCSVATAQAVAAEFAAFQTGAETSSLRWTESW